MVTAKFQPPPTYAMPVVEDQRTKTLVFNPIWLKWFLDLSQNLGIGGAGSGSGDGSVTSVVTGAGLTGGPITDVGTISLAPVGTAGTYGSVTTNAHGQVIAGNPGAEGTFGSVTTNAYGQVTAGNLGARGTFGSVTTNAYGQVTASNLGAKGTFGNVTTNAYGQVIAGAAPERGLNTVITTAKLTTTGVNGSMTFTNGRLTAQTAAT